MNPSDPVTDCLMNHRSVRKFKPGHSRNTNRDRATRPH